MAAELKKDFGEDAKLTPGSGGEFEVVVDGAKVFSKKSLGRFPAAGEVSSLLKGKSGK